jgi:hypothetical protein
LQVLEEVVLRRTSVLAGLLAPPLAAFHGTVRVW